MFLKKGVHLQNLSIKMDVSTNFQMWHSSNKNLKNPKIMLCSYNFARKKNELNFFQSKSPLNVTFALFLLTMTYSVNVYYCLTASVLVVKWLYVNGLSSVHGLPWFGRWVYNPIESKMAVDCNSIPIRWVRGIRGFLLRSQLAER